MAVTCAYLVAWMYEEKAEQHGIEVKTKKRISELIDHGDEAGAAKMVDRKMIDLLTVSGNVEDCIEKCKEYLKYDVDQLAFCEPFGPRPVHSIEIIAKKVIPRL